MVVQEVLHDRPRSSDGLLLSRALRLPTAVVCVYMLVLFALPQAREVIMRELEIDDWTLLVRSYTSILFFSFVLLIYTTDSISMMDRETLYISAGHAPIPGRRKAWGELQKWTPLWLAASPLWATLLAQEVFRYQFNIPNTLMAASMGVDVRWLCFGACLMATLLLYNISYLQYQGARYYGADRLSHALASWREFLVVVAIPLVVLTGTCRSVIILVRDPAATTGHAGPISVLTDGLVLTLIVLSLVRRRALFKRRPYFLIWLAIWGCFSILAVALDGRIAWFHREVYYLTPLPKSDTRKVALDKGVQYGTELSATQLASLYKLYSTQRGLDGAVEWHQRWAAARVAAGIPVTMPIVVAAQGGGMYAAHHAALTLARIQDRCPQFASMLLAMSGVSGGALGISAFVAAVEAVRAHEQLVKTGNRISRGWKQVDCQADGLDEWKGPHEILVSRFFFSFFLTPLIAGTIYFDRTNFIFPYKHIRLSPERPWRDRARALEMAITRKWQNVIDEQLGRGLPNFFARSALSHGGPDLLPALMFSGTIAETGELAIVGPVSIYRSDRSRGAIHYLPAVDTQMDINIATAVVMSARFPYVTPAATLPNRTGLVGQGAGLARISIVDGGYFENSGATPLVAFLEDLRFKIGKSALGIMFSHEVYHKYDGALFRELLVPVRTALNVGTIGGVEALQKLRSWCASCLEYKLMAPRRFKWVA